MSNDVYNFNAEYKSAKIVTARNMILTVGGQGTPSQGDYLVQNVTISYQQPINLIREISTGNAYYHALPPQGSMSIGRIVGKSPITAVLGAPGQGIWVAPNSTSNTGFNADEVGRIVVLQPLAGQQGPKYSMFGCIVETFGASTDANGSLVQSNVTVRFGRLDLEKV